MIYRENIVGKLLSMLSTAPTSTFLSLRDADADMCFKGAGDLLATILEHLVKLF